MWRETSQEAGPTAPYHSFGLETYVTPTVPWPGGRGSCEASITPKAVQMTEIFFPAVAYASH